MTKSINLQCRESLFFMDTKATKEKKTKEKKEKSPMVKKSIFIITCTCVAVGSAAIGGVGTYFIYGLLKPEMSYEVDFVDYKKLEQRINSSKDFKVEFKDDQYNIINELIISSLGIKYGVYIQIYFWACDIKSTYKLLL